MENNESKGKKIMAIPKFYGDTIPNIEKDELKGKLIVMEGTDGIGRSTYQEKLKEWLESLGYAVIGTTLTTSKLAGKGLSEAKKGHTMSMITMTLFYSTDFADILENEIISALRAGFIVLADRYIYTNIVRAIVRGADKKWIKDVYGFALIPDVIFYLKVDIDTLIPRIMHGAGFNYWEAGMDLRLGEDLYDSFIEYQSRLIDEYDKMSDEYNFTEINASQSIDEIVEKLKKQIKPLILK